MAPLKGLWRVATLLRHPLRHRQLSVLLGEAPMRHFVADKVKLRLKYLVDYAARGLSTQQRYELLLAHYDFVQQRFEPSFLRAVSHGRLRLWQLDDSQADQADAALAIDLDFPASMQTEGELCLTLMAGSNELFRLIFLVAGGATFRAGQAHLLLITCVQGLRPAADMRVASARCADVHPADLLMAALAGLAAALAIDTLIGIRTIHQIANKGRIHFSYDEFFAQYGQHRADIDCYQIGLPYPQTPLHELAAKRRGRSRSKRALKAAVAETVAQSLAPFLEQDGAARASRRRALRPARPIAAGGP